MADIPIRVLYPDRGIFLCSNPEPKCLSLKNVTTSRDVWDAMVVIYIETVKVASSQHCFYFDVHKVCGKGVKLHSVGGKHSIFCGEYGLDISTFISVCDK